MYSGITQGLFKIVSCEREPGLLTYSVELSLEMTKNLKPGASVSINGVCQTVVNIDENLVVTFQAMQETLRLTTLNELTVGDEVSVERSLKVGDENGGHDVAGHVNGTAVVKSVHKDGHDVCLTLQCPESWMRYIHEKGFIAVDGSSLTVGRVSAKDATFDIHLIPETLKMTNFKHKQLGDKVNIELDQRTVAIVNAVENYLKYNNINTLSAETTKRNSNQ